MLSFVSSESESVKISNVIVYIGQAPRTAFIQALTTTEIIPRFACFVLNIKIVCGPLMFRGKVHERFQKYSFFKLSVNLFLSTLKRNNSTNIYFANLKTSLAESLKIYGELAHFSAT